MANVLTKTINFYIMFDKILGKIAHKMDYLVAKKDRAVFGVKVVKEKIVVAILRTERMNMPIKMDLTATNGVILSKKKASIVLETNPPKHVNSVILAGLLKGTEPTTKKTTMTKIEMIWKNNHKTR